MNTPIKTRIYHPNAGSQELLADDSETMGVVRTMRLKQGDHIACFNGDGYENQYSVSSIEKRFMTASLVGQIMNPRDPQVGLTILLASTKGKTKDQMVKELTALGATNVFIYQAHRSVAMPDEKHTGRLQKIAIESCRQCERSTIPKVEIHSKTIDQLDNEIFTKDIICFYEKANWEDTPKLEKTDKPVTLIFGPEGGFTDEEVAFMRKKNAQFCSLGRRILRAELAVSVGTTLIQSQRNSL